MPALAIAIVAFTAARIALQPGVEFWDTGEFQTVGPLMGTAHPTGYPTYTLIGWLAAVLLQPLGEPALEPGALVISGWSFSTPLWYAQLIEGRRPDIVVVDDRTRVDEDLGTMTGVIEANLGRRPVYLMRQNQAIVPFIESRYIVEYPAPEEIGLLIHILDRRTQAP